MPRLIIWKNGTACRHTGQARTWARVASSVPEYPLCWGPPRTGTGPGPHIHPQPVRTPGLCGGPQPWFTDGGLGSLQRLCPRDCPGAGGRGGIHSMPSEARKLQCSSQSQNRKATPPLAASLPQLTGFRDAKTHPLPFSSLYPPPSVLSLWKGAISWERAAHRTFREHNPVLENKIRLYLHKYIENKSTKMQTV